jgi:hypothetical protein
LKPGGKSAYLIVISVWNGYNKTRRGLKQVPAPSNP